jgi:hypothetical protein
LERDFLTLLRLKPDFVDVDEQPQTFFYVDRAGAERKYTPDFRAILAHGVVYYEVKYKDQLRADWERFSHIVPFMRRHLREAEGANFRIVTEKTIRSVRSQNFLLLAGHASRKPDAKMVAVIINHLRHSERRTIGELLSDIDGPDRGRFYATLWPLIVRRGVFANLDQPLSMKTVVGCIDERA